MTLLVVYVILVAIAETTVFAVGIALDSIVPAGWNLILAMVMFFGVIWVMWPISVFVTERWLMPAMSRRDGRSAKHAPSTK
jgi:antibiotic biosynthesis monooxygenase (ABM) superfamily enzyme